MNLVEQIQRFLEPLRINIRSMILKAIVRRVDDSQEMQLIQIDLLHESTKSFVERIQNFGFTSNPKSGSQALALFLNGNKDHGIIIAVDDVSYRMKSLPEGGTAVYDAFGNSIVLTSSGIAISTASGKEVEISCKDCNINLESGGKFSVAGSNLTVDA